MTNGQKKARDAISSVISVCDTITDILPAYLEAFERDIRSQWAIEMGLIRIGEGVNRIPADILEQYDGQPWRRIVAMRNFAAHQYDDLDPGRVWRTVTLDIPALRAYLADVVLEGLH